MSMKITPYEPSPNDVVSAPVNLDAVFCLICKDTNDPITPDDNPRSGVIHIAADDNHGVSGWAHAGCWYDNDYSPHD